MLENNPRQPIQPAPISEPSDLEEKLAAMIGKELLDLPSEFDWDADLYRAGLDSMALMRLLILIENHFGLILTEADLSRENFASIRKLAALIRLRVES